MKILLLSKDDYYARLDTPHNPPDAAISDSAFAEEYYKLFNRVSAIMSEHGSNDPYDDGDYYLEPAIARSRGLGLAISNPSIVTASLLGRLQSVVAQYASDWEIYLGSSLYDFGIFIGASSIRMHRNKEGLLPQLSEFVDNVG